MMSESPRYTSELKKVNRNRVYRCLYEHPQGMTKQDLAYTLSLSLPTLSQNLKELMTLGLIDNSKLGESVGGRRPHLLTVVPKARWAVGVDISSNHVRLVALDLQVDELKFHTVFCPFQAEAAYGQALARTVEKFIDDVGLDRTKLLGVGVTVPGIVDDKQKSVTTAYTLGVRHIEASQLIGYIPYSVYLVNDANAGGYAESWGRTDSDPMAYLSLSRGVGGAILLSDGTAYLGRSGRSGEFGHMCVHPGGALCSCGRRGCLEVSCSTARLSDDLGLSLDEFFLQLDEGNQAYRLLWERYLEDLSVGISSIHTALDCAIVLGGKLSRFLAGKRLAELSGKLRLVDPEQQTEPYLSICRHHDRSNGIGAALYLVDQFIRQI